MFCLGLLLCASMLNRPNQPSNFVVMFHNQLWFSSLATHGLFVCIPFFCCFPLVTWRLHSFQMKYVAINTDHLSNPNSHYEGNMNNPVIIPCCLKKKKKKNLGTLDGIYFFCSF